MTEAAALGWRWRPSLAVAALVLAAACMSGGERERRVADLETSEAATRAKHDALAPLSGSPARNQDGQPQIFEAYPEIRADEAAKADCPSASFAVVRNEQGASCATYQAEISTFIERCVAECDAADIARRTVELGAGRCSQFCSEKKCGARVTFVPPPEGCAVSDCGASPTPCPDPACPLLEYCSLLDINRVWNCFCRDLIEP